MSNARNIASGAKFVDTAGDTMTGALTVGGAVTINPDADSSLEIKDGGTNALFMTAATGDELYIGANGTYAFRIKNDGTKDVAFDNGGRVTMPSQPSFYAYTSTDYTAEGALTGGGNWAERWDTGNNFSAGTFTAPVAGKYFFSVMWDANAIRSTIDLEVNGTAMIRYEPTGRTDDTWETHALTGMVSLAANDTVRLYGSKHSQSSNNPYHMGGGLWGHFVGFLIG